VKFQNGTIKNSMFNKGSSVSAVNELAQKLKNNFEEAQYEVTLSGDYPGWNPNS